MATHCRPGSSTVLAAARRRHLASQIHQGLGLGGRLVRRGHRDGRRHDGGAGGGLAERIVATVKWVVVKS